MKKILFVSALIVFVSATASSQTRQQPAGNQDRQESPVRAADEGKAPVVNPDGTVTEQAPVKTKANDQNNRQAPASEPQNTKAAERNSDGTIPEQAPVKTPSNDQGRREAPKS